jgi:hypothetical protein
MNSATKAFRRLMLYPAPAVNPTPKLVNLAVGFTGTTTGIARFGVEFAVFIEIILLGAQ